MRGAIMSEVDHLFPQFTSLERKQWQCYQGTLTINYHGDYSFHACQWNQKPARHAGFAF